MAGRARIVGAVLLRAVISHAQRRAGLESAEEGEKSGLDVDVYDQMYGLKAG